MAKYKDVIMYCRLNAYSEFLVSEEKLPPCLVEL